MRNALDVRYLDGRNHALDLVSSFVKSMRKRKNVKDKDILDILSDRWTLEDALQDFDPGYFNDHNEDIGPIY